MAISKESKESKIVFRKPFDLQEAVILLDVYLTFNKKGASTNAAAKIASQRLRALAVSRGMEIDDSFRSVLGIRNRLDIIGCVYEGTESKSNSGTRVFREAVELYKNNRKKFEHILSDFSTHLLPEQSRVNRENEGSELGQMEEHFNAEEQAFLSWLPSVMQQSIIVEVKRSFKIISMMLVQKNALPQPIIETKRIEQVERALRLSKSIFGNKKMRTTAQKLLGVYVAYLNKEDSSPIKKEMSEVDVQEDWIKFDFSNSDQFERTVPAYCNVKGYELEGKNWTRILAALVEHEIEKNNPALKLLYKQPLTENKKNRPFFLTEKIEGLHCSKLSNGYWINLNYSIPGLMNLILAFCLRCGYDKADLTIYGMPKGRVSNLINEHTKKEAEVISQCDGIPLPLRNAIKMSYTTGMRFDDTVLSLLSNQSGLQITDAMCDFLHKKMFKRNDGLYFLPEQITDKKGIQTIKEETLGFLETYKMCEVSKLYEIISLDASIASIRDEEDYADFLAFLLTDSVRVGKAYTFKIVRPTGISINDATAYLTNKLLTTINENGCMTEDDLLITCPIVSGQFLKKLLEKNTDEVVTTTINDFLCYQTIEAMGLDESFSKTLDSVLSKANELELPPTLEVLHILLSVEIGHNFRNTYGIPDDKTFRRIIAMYYRGEKAREWKAGNFMEVHLSNV